MRCRACTASCYQMAVTASVAGERYSLVCFCLACSVPVLAPICQTAFVAPRPHERELSGHERSTCTAVHALPAATRWQPQLASLASATHLFASAGRVRCMCMAPICHTAFVAPRPHERELSGHERSTCTAVRALPAATRWQPQPASLASATHLFASAGRVRCMCWRPSARQLSSLHAHMSES